MLKRLDALFVSVPKEIWLKLTCTLQQEFVICAFTESH